MELRLQLPRGTARDVDWFAAGVAGFAAGAVLMVLELAWAASMSAEGPWHISKLVAALTMGEAALGAPAGRFDVVIVAVALITHYALGILSGLVVGWFLSAIHRVEQLGIAELVGGLFGFFVYLANFHLLTVLAPWFVELRGWATLIGHIVFGITAAVLYSRLARPSIIHRRSS